MVDPEGDLALGELDLLRVEIDAPLARMRKRLTVLLGQHDRQQPYLRAVGIEDIGEARRDDRLETVVLQPPGGVLTRRAAAKVATRDKDRVGGQFPARLLGPVVEQELPEAGALHPLEELLGHDLVGVHIGAVEVGDLAGDRIYRVHCEASQEGRGASERRTEGPTHPAPCATHTSD